MKTKPISRKALLAMAEQFKIGVDLDAPFDSIELSAPEGMQFDAELHHLVTQRDMDNKEPMGSFYGRVAQDVATYGPRISKCPEGCPCKETD